MKTVMLEYYPNKFTAAMLTLLSPVKLSPAYLLLQSQDILTRKDPNKIPSSKRVVQNLRCSEMGGGLLDRTLITLVSNTVRFDMDSCSMLQKTAEMMIDARIMKLFLPKTRLSLPCIILSAKR